MRFEAEIINAGDISNGKFCRVKSGEKTIMEYTPYQVNEYMLEYGQIYKSYPIVLKDTASRYFIEILSQGKINLYYLKIKRGVTKFYINENDSSELTEIPQKDIHTFLSDYINIKDCPQALDNSSYLKYKKGNLERFFQDYNNCNIRPFPKFHYGIMVGVAATRLSTIKVSGNYSTPKYNDWSISVGIFIDAPMGFTNFSFHPEIYYKRTSISKIFENENTKNDIVIDYSSINIPLLFRYSFLNNKTFPYIQVGPIYSRTIKNKSILYEYAQTSDETFTNSVKLKQENLGGFSIGCGIISNIGSKYKWFGEMRYSKLYNLNVKDGSKITLFDQLNQLNNFNEIIMGIGFMF
jgi:hypothetical protein